VAVAITAKLFALMVVSIMISLGIFARSFKEAQSYMTPLQLLTVIPIVFLQFSDFLKITTPYFALPFVNVMLLLDALVKGAATPEQILVTWVSTLGYAALALGFAYQSFRREDVIFRS
jgi:sodium transport system permease protein